LAVARFRRLFRFTSRAKSDIDADLQDEIAFHLEMRIRELMARGWTAEAAKREATRQFGDQGQTASYCRRLDADKERGMRFRILVGELWQDLVYGARMFSRQPGLSAVALLTIALGIGATTLVFSVVYASLLAPLPYANADRLVVVRLSLPDSEDAKASVDVFEDSGVWASNQYMMDDEQVLGGAVTPGVFSTLGVPAQIGRVIEGSDGPAPVVVLGHGIWQRRFGGDPQVIGRTLHLSGMGYTIVGVMPPQFRFPSRAFQLWANMNSTMSRAPEQAKNRALRIFQTVGRLRPSVSQQQAQAQFTALAERQAKAYPKTNTGVPMTLTSLSDRLLGYVRPALFAALGSVGCLLLIACANVANLSLARMTARTQELAVRTALGAGRWRIARQLVTESVLIATCGGLLGVALARWGLSILPSLMADRVPRIEDVALSLPVLAVSAATIVLGGLLVAVVPVLHLSVSEIEPSLKGGGRGEGETRFGARIRSALVVAQISMAVVVLAGALVLSRSLIRLLNVDAGFVPDRLLTFNTQLVQIPTAGGRAETATRVLEAIRGVPGVEAAGGATGLAPVTAQRGTSFEVEGHADAPVEDRSGYFIAASPGYFRALGTRLIAGREFSVSDASGAPLVAIISNTVARRFFPDGDAVGRRLRLVNPEQSDAWRTVVGVVGDVQYSGLDDENQSVVYTPFAQTPFLWIYVQVRTVGDPDALIGSVRSAVKSVDARLTVANPQPMTALVTQSSADPRFTTTLISAFAVLATLLAAIGLYGVVSFGVARKTREIAIRMALGASAASVRWAVLRRSLVLASAGVILGLLGAAWMGRMLTEMLYQTTPTDPLALTIVAALLLIVAVGASVVPARRATRVQPIEALREG
jgi:putative ABC transport system permease protein